MVGVSGVSCTASDGRSVAGDGGGAGVVTASVLAA